MSTRFDGTQKKQLSRFLLSGGLNTALTYALYLLLLTQASYAFSYSIAFATGICLAYLLNRFFVFRVHQGMQSLLAMPVIYFLQYLVGLAVIWLWVEMFSMDPRWGPVISIVVTLPMTYILSHRVFAGKISRASLDGTV